jgi:glycosyltransferase involved in cell wall biosynthesis
VFALGAKDLSEILRSTPHDVLMMNGFFDREFTIPALFLRWMGRVPRKPTILSTRGEFGEGAIGLKSSRKTAYLGLARRLGLLSDVWLHATSSQEASDVHRGFPWCRDILVAPNISRLSEFRSPRSGGGGGIRLLFLGRITRVKNLHFALEALRNVRTSVRFDIIGPVNDAGYWQECKRIVAMLPTHITVRQLGPISNADVSQTMRGYDLLFLPTAGENFGHSIFEALSSGVPVLISDQTPWHDLEKKDAGWDLPLDDTQRFSRAIDSFSKLDFAARVHLARGARALAEKWVKESDAVDRNRAMLRQALGRTAICTSVASGEVCP